MQKEFKRASHIVALGVLTIALLVGLPAAGHATEETTGGVLKASDVIGMKVQDLDGKKLGTIKDLVIDREDGDIQYAVLDFGGVIGIGNKYFAVPWEALQGDVTKDKIALDVHKKDLKNAPGFDKDNWPDFSQPQIAVYEFYELSPPDRDRTTK